MCFPRDGESGEEKDKKRELPAVREGENPWLWKLDLTAEASLEHGQPQTQPARHRLSVKRRKQKLTVSFNLILLFRHASNSIHDDTREPLVFIY